MKNIFLLFLLLGLLSCQSNTSSSQGEGEIGDNNPTVPTAEVFDMVEKVVNKKWSLHALSGSEIANDRVFIELKSEGDQNKLKGFGGCNNLFGNFKIKDNVLRIETLARTKKNCPGIDLEDKLVRALQRSHQMSLSKEGGLILSNGEQGIIEFK